MDSEELEPLEELTGSEELDSSDELGVSEPGVLDSPDDSDGPSEGFEASELEWVLSVEVPLVPADSDDVPLDGLSAVEDGELGSAEAVAEDVLLEE